MSLCIGFLVVVLGITIYIHTFNSLLESRRCDVVIDSMWGWGKEGIKYDTEVSGLGNLV